WLWGLLRSQPGTIHVTCRHPRRGERPFFLHRADLAPADLARRNGIPVTSLSRTILDVAVDSRLRTVRRHVQRAEDLRVFDLREMDDRAGRTKGHRGQGKGRGALEPFGEGAVLPRLGARRRVLELVVEAGLAEPSMNRFVAGHEIDAYWEAERFGVEL